MVWPPYAARDFGKLMHGLIPGNAACWKCLGTSKPRIYLPNLKLNTQRSRTGSGLMELHYKLELEHSVVVLRRTLVEARVPGARCSFPVGKFSACWRWRGPNQSLMARRYFAPFPFLRGNFPISNNQLRGNASSVRHEDPLEPRKTQTF